MTKTEPMPEFLLRKEEIAPFVEILLSREDADSILTMTIKPYESGAFFALGVTRRFEGTSR